VVLLTSPALEIVSVSVEFLQSSNIIPSLVSFLADMLPLALIVYVVVIVDSFRSWQSEKK